MNKKRLLKVAQALRESKSPKDFDMAQYGRTCGTPACALGHYASRRDLQRTFTLKFIPFDGGGGFYNDLLAGRHPVNYRDDAVLEHFDLTSEQAEELFAGHGCNRARTPKGAAQYIERFVKRQERSRTRPV